jgi:hypothetical protein
MNTLDDSQSQQSQSLLPSPTPSPAVAATTTTTLHQGTDEEEQWETSTVQQHPEDAAAPIQEQDGDETQLDTQFQTHEDEDGTQDAQQIGAFAFALAAANNDDWISTKKAPASSHFVAAPSAAPPRPTNLTPSASMETQPASLPVSQEDPPSEDFMPHLTNRSESAAVAADQEADAEVAAVTESAVAESAAGGPNEGDKTPLLEEEPPVMAEKPANACLFERSVMGTVSPLAQPSTEPEPVLSPAADHTTADDMDLEQYDTSAEKADEVAENDNDNDNDNADHAERNEEEENETPLQSRSDAEGVNETTATEREEENDNPVTAGVIADVTTTLQDMGCTLASTAVQQVKSRAQSAEELLSFALDWIDNATTRSTRSNVTTSAREAAAPVTETTAIRSNPTHPRAYVPAVSTMRLRSVHFRAAKKPPALVSTTTRKVVSRKRTVTATAATATAAKTTTPTKRTYTATTTAVPTRASSRTRSSLLTRAPATPTHKRQLRFDGGSEPKTKKPRVAKSVVKRCSTLCLATRAGSQNLALRPVSRLVQ